MTTKAFVCSTFVDLKSHREHVINQLRRSGIQVDPMEDWPASSEEPKEFSQQRVEGCDLCVLLLAWRRGHVPIGQTKSITQLEYEYAIDHGIEVLAFLLSESEPWIIKYDERSTDPEVQNWRAALGERHGVEFFKLDPTSVDILPALHRTIAEMNKVSGDVQTGRANVPAADRLRRILDSKRILCGCVKHPPLSDFKWIGDQVHFSGLYVELARQVAADQGLEVEFRPVEWSRLPTVFTSPSKLDVVLSVFETRARFRTADFSAALHTVGVGAVSRLDNDKIGNVEDLKGNDVKLVVSEGEVGWEYAIYELRLPPHRLMVLDDADLTALVDGVVSGRADAAICDLVTCQRIVAGQPDVVHSLFDDEPLYLCKNAVMIPQGEESLGDWVAEQFEAARAIDPVSSLEVRILADHPAIRRFT